MNPLVIVFLVLLVLSGVGLIIFILMHSGKGTGISDMIASSMYSTQTGTSIIEKNLDRITIGCAIVFLAGQRTRASLAVFTGFCLLWGTANFFIITFKGQPIVPADLFALGTAASVAGGYSLFLTGRLVFCWALFAAYCVALAKLCPNESALAGT